LRGAESRAKQWAAGISDDQADGLEVQYLEAPGIFRAYASFGGRLRKSTA